jgi:hypothetical protein
LRREFLPLFNRIKRIDGRPERARTVDLHRVKLAPLGFATTYKTAGTAK